ncbi:MAG: ribonuclease E/G, partial [Sphingomicrobium sp.]
EKAMKDALKNDRARIQVGRISSFGLMEMSRQRLRTGVLEASTKACPHCEGTGLMRTASSAGLSALRMVEDEAARGRGEKIQLRAGREAAIYLLNKKRFELGEIEQRYGVSIEVVIDESLEGARMNVESSGPRPVAPQRLETFVAPVEDDDEFEEEEEIEAALVGAEEAEELAERAPSEHEPDRERGRERERDDEGEGPRRRRRRRRGGRGRGRRDGQLPAADEGRTDEQVEAEALPPAMPAEGYEGEEAEAPKPRSRRRRGRGKAGAEAQTAVEPDSSAHRDVEPDSSPMVETPLAEEPPIAAATPEEETPEVEEPKARRRPRARKGAAATSKAAQTPAPEPEPKPEPEPDPGPVPTKPTRKRRSKTAAAEPAQSSVEAAPAREAEPTSKSVPSPDNDSAMTDAEGERRSGWWSRTFG